MPSVLQPWVQNISIMQQTVLLGAIRGPDGIGKFHKVKPFIRWYRRCVVMSAFDNRVLTTPFELGGGSFTGPIKFSDYDLRFADDLEARSLELATDNFVDSRDELPFHYSTHMMHAAEILGYKHPDPATRRYWCGVYSRMVHALHLWPETEAQLDLRLGDTEPGWRARNDSSATCSD